MSYTLDNKDIVISGWEEGIRDNPYQGIYDMRNCEIVSIPGEISIGRKTQSDYTRTEISGAAVTVDSGTSVFTYSGTPTLTIGTPIVFSNSGGALPTGLSNTQTYYVLTTPTAQTFTISLSYGGSQKTVSDAGTGTHTFSAINMGTPQQIVKWMNSNAMYALVDDNGRIWAKFADHPTVWAYANNLSSELITETTNRISFFKNYLIVSRTQSSGYLGYNQINNLDVFTLKSNWNLTWETGPSNPTYFLYGNDGILYFTNGPYIGSLIQNSGTTFNPTTASTYTLNLQVCGLAYGRNAISLAELGTGMLIGTTDNIIYSWDRLTAQPSGVIYLSENYVKEMVTVNSTVYIFAGFSGRIFITNGGNATPFWKIPDYLQNTTYPYIRWRCAGFNRNQLYFGFSAKTNAGTAINETGALWAVDVDGNSPTYPRIQNILSYNTYNGYVSAICQDRSSSTSDPSNDGYGMFIGWYNGTNGGVDKSITTPYTSGESYVITDPIPVGTFKTKRTFENIEYKLGAPLVAGESVTVYYRTDLSAAFTQIPITSGGGTGDISGLSDTLNFENAQWVQFKIVLNGTSTNPSYVRLREIRLR